jgi:hypothetical protein
MKLRKTFRRGALRAQGRAGNWGDEQRQKQKEARVRLTDLMAFIKRADAAGLHRRSMQRLSDVPCIILTEDRKAAVYLDVGEVRDYDTGNAITLEFAAQILGLGGAG